MKVKDLLANIEKYRQEYPDIDDWEVYTEQPDLIAPEHNISYEEYFKAVENNEPTIDYCEEQKQWTVSAGFNDFFWFDTKEEAEKFAANYGSNNQEYHLQMLQSYNKIKELEKSGWKFKFDGEGWVYRDTTEYAHTLFPNDKIFTINNNY